MEKVITFNGRNPIPEGIRGHPSHFVSPKVKESKEYTRMKLEAIDAESTSGTYSMFRAKAEDYADWRSYAAGDQSVDQYKQVLMNPKHKRKGGRINRDQLSYKVLDWTPLGVAPKFVNVLVGRLIGQDNTIGVKAVDPKAIDARRQKEISMQEWVLNQQFLAEIQKTTGIQFASPMEQDAIPPPTNLQEVRNYMDMFYKEHYCLALMDMLTVLKDQDNYSQVLKMAATDLVEVGVGVTKTYRIGNRIKRRRCIPERMVTNNCKAEDFSDFEYGGEYWDLSIGELRELVQDQLTEDELKDIASQVSGKQFDDVTPYFKQYHAYPYDNIRITVLDAVWFSPDQETYEETINSYGNITTYDKEWDWAAQVSTDEYNNSTVNKARGSKMRRRVLNNLYQGMLVVGTKYVFNHGKCRDMLRNESDIGTCIGPFCIYSIKPIMKMLKPVFDSIQRNWLQYQHHINKSRPQGLDIEFTALQDVNIGGAGGEKMKPKDVLELYFDTGILLWKRRDWSGASNNWRPINELQNGLSPAAAQHFQNIVSEMDLLRAMVGLTDVASAETPNAETSKKATELGDGAVEDAIRYLYHAFDQVNIGTAKRTIMHISAMAANGMAPDYTEAIGTSSMLNLQMLADIGAHEYGAYLIREDTKEMKARLRSYTEAGIATGTLYTYEAWEIEHEPNPYRAISLLKMYQKQKDQAKQQQMMETYQAELQKNIESANATEDAKRQSLQFEYQLKGEYELAAANARMIENREKLRDEILLEKVKQGGQLNEEQEKRVTELMKINTQGQWDVMIADRKAKEAEAKRKEQAAKKPKVA